MEAPFKVEIVATDAAGDEIVLFRNSKLSHEAFVAVECVIARGLAALGEAGLETKKQKDAAK